MKLSDEFKVGVFATIAIVILILGVNFLKGRDVFASNDMLYAKYRKIDGLTKANPVYLNGLQVGKVVEIETAYDENDTLIITVGFTVDPEVKIPTGSVAFIGKPDILGSMAIILSPAKNQSILAEDGEFLIGKNKVDIFAQMEAVLTPLKAEAEELISGMSKTIGELEKTFDEGTQEDIKESVSNLKDAMVSVKSIMRKGDGEFKSITANFKEAGSNLKSSSQKLDETLDNINTLTDSLKQAPINSVVVEAKLALEKLNKVLTAAEGDESTLGMLVNDKELYEKLDSAVESFDELAKDIKAHPKTYLAPLGKKNNKND
ncbi:MAG: MCE family protein [Bacteroidia bacterium]